MKLSSLFASAVAVCAMAAASSAYAATATTTFQVTANVSSACNISATGIAFGTVAPGSTPLPASGSYTYSCNSSPTSVTFASANGFTLVKTSTNNSTAAIPYNLYYGSTTTSPSTQVGGASATSNTYTFGANAPVSPGAQPLTASIPNGIPAGALADNYTDTVTVTLTY